MSMCKQKEKEVIVYIFIAVNGSGSLNEVQLTLHLHLGSVNSVIFLLLLFNFCNFECFRDSRGNPICKVQKSHQEFKLGA